MPLHCVTVRTAMVLLPHPLAPFPPPHDFGCRSSRLTRDGDPRCPTRGCSLPCQGEGWSGMSPPAQTNCDRQREIEYKEWKATARANTKSGRTKRQFTVAENENEDGTGYRGPRTAPMDDRRRNKTINMKKEKAALNGGTKIKEVFGKVVSIYGLARSFNLSFG